LPVPSRTPISKTNHPKQSKTISDSHPNVKQNLQDINP